MLDRALDKLLWISSRWLSPIGASMYECSIQSVSGSERFWKPPHRTPGLLMGLDGSDILDLTSVIPLTVVSS